MLITAPTLFPEIMDSKAVSNFLNISLSTLNKYIKVYALPKIQVEKNGKLLFKKSQVEKWLDRFQNKPFRKVRNKC